MDALDAFPWRPALALTIGAVFLLYGLLRWLEHDDEPEPDTHELAEWVDMPAAERDPTKE